MEINFYGVIRETHRKLLVYAAIRFSNVFFYILLL